MTWATAQTCGSAAAKLVLVMLANHSNGHTGQCNPRHKMLAQECDMTVETLKAHLKKLQSLGLIEIVAKYADGVQLPNQYLLSFDGGGGISYTHGSTNNYGEGGYKNPPTYNQEVKPGIKPSLSPEAPCPHHEIINLFAKHLPELPTPKPELWNGARAKALQQRWKWLLSAKKSDGTRYAENREQALEWFGRFFDYVSKSDFLTGKQSKWCCDLGWLVKAENFAKVIQGNYENKNE